MLQSTKAEFASTLLKSPSEDIAKVELGDFKFEITICETSVVENQLEDLQDWLKLHY